MKEPHRKGVANRSNPESCAGGGNIAGEALTGAHAGQPSSSEITSIGVPTLSPEGEGHTADSVNRELSVDAAESETLSMSRSGSPDRRSGSDRNYALCSAKCI